MSGFERPARLARTAGALPRTVATLLAAAALLAGCSITETISEKGRIDYKSAGKLPPLDLPPDLSQMRGDDRFSMPDRPANGDRTFSQYSAAQPAQRNQIR